MEIGGDLSWGAAAQRTRDLVLNPLLDPAAGFFYVLVAVTKDWPLFKSPTGFYPFWAGIGQRNHL